MDYKFHCQYQAEAFANAILPVPGDYPLKTGLPEEFRLWYAKFCDIAKNMYLDMAKRPEGYGLTLVDIKSGDKNEIRKGQNSIHRLLDTLQIISECGELSDHILTVNVTAFNEAIRNRGGNVAKAVPKYELILSRLTDFGFAFSGFTGGPYNKNDHEFTVRFPDAPEATDAFKIYCDCWAALKTDRSSIKIWKEEFHHHFYRFDYKVTADHSLITYQQWIEDNSKFFGYPDNVNDFYVAFYEYSLRYKGVKFNGDYNFKSKRIARDLQRGNRKYSLSMKLRNMDNYMDVIETMPDSIQSEFKASRCNHCNFQGATQEYCKFRLHWTYGGEPYEGCAHMCFEFNDYDIERVADYWRLLELDNGLIQQ